LLLLLKFLPILFLLCQHFFLLLLVFFIAVGVSGVGRSWTIEGRKLFRMNCGARRPAGAMRLTATTIGGRVVSRPGFFCGHCGVKVSWSIRSGNWRLALVGRGPKLRVVAGCLEMLGLSGNGRNMTLMLSGFLLRPRTRFNAAGTAVIADVIHRDIVYHGFVVHVMDVDDVNIGHRTVVEEVVVVPASTFEAETEIAEAVDDSAIETDMRTPPAVMEKIHAVAPAP